MQVSQFNKIPNTGSTKSKDEIMYGNFYVVNPYTMGDIVNSGGAQGNCLGAKLVYDENDPYNLKKYKWAWGKKGEKNIDLNKPNTSNALNFFPLKPIDIDYSFCYNKFLNTVHKGWDDKQIYFKDTAKNEKFPSLLRKLKSGTVFGFAECAYFLATTIHESFYTFEPIKEKGGENKPYSPYYGRGYIQITHDYNYCTVSHLLNEDVFNNPDNVINNEDLAYRIANYGMLFGLFRSVKLIDYINKIGNNFFDARKIIQGSETNGNKIARSIETHALRFERWLQGKELPEKSIIYSNITNILNVTEVTFYIYNKSNSSFIMNKVHVELRIDDIHGQTIITLFEKNIFSGEFNVELNDKIKKQFRETPSGTYFLKLFVNSSVSDERTILIME